MPRENTYLLDSKNNKLKLNLSPETFKLRGQYSLMGFRQKETEFEYSAHMSFKPKKNNSVAGLSVCSQDENYINFTMKKEDLNQWVEELFLELPDTKKELEQLLFQRAFSSIINFPVMKAVFQQLNKKMKFDVIEKVEALINMAKGDQKELLRQQGFRSSFQILTSKGIQISSEQFSEALQQDLIRYDPQSFESETKSSTEEI